MLESFLDSIYESALNENIGAALGSPIKFMKIKNHLPQQNKGKFLTTLTKVKAVLTYQEMVEMIEDQHLPFTEEIFDGYIIRHFDPSYPEHLFKWHWDKEDRTVEVLNDSDWRFQYDNELPIPMVTGVDIKIPRGVIHRIIKGTTPLSVKILLD